MQWRTEAMHGWMVMCLPQAQLGAVLSSFISCATGIQRLSRPELVNGLLGAKQSEVHELTPLVDLVVPPECQELVRGQFVESSLSTATLRRGRTCKACREPLCTAAL